MRQKKILKSQLSLKYDFWKGDINITFYDDIKIVLKLGGALRKIA